MPTLYVQKWRTDELVGARKPWDRKGWLYPWEEDESSLEWKAGTDRGDYQSDK